MGRAEKKCKGQQHFIIFNSFLQLLEQILFEKCTYVKMNGKMIVTKHQVPVFLHFQSVQSSSSKTQGMLLEIESINNEMIAGHVPKLMTLWLTKFLERLSNKRKSCCERQACKQRGQLWLRNVSQEMSSQICG